MLHISPTKLKYNDQTLYLCCAVECPFITFEILQGRSRSRALSAAPADARSVSDSWLACYHCHRRHHHYICNNAHILL